MSNLSRLVVAGGFLLAAAGLRAEAPAPAAPAAPEPPKSQGLTLSVGDALIRFYGNLRLDMHYDTAHPNNNQLIYCVKSLDPAAPAGIGEPDKQPDFVMHAKLTRFGIDVSSAPIAALSDAKIGGKLEIDFLAQSPDVTSASTSRPIIRLRHAYTRLAWDDLSLTLGQTNDIIAPLAPTVNAEFVMWGAGNVGDRRPQVSADYHPSVGIGTVILQGEVGLTGALDNQNLDTSTLADGTASGYPTLQARVAFKGDHLWLEKKSFEVGLWGTWGKEYVDAAALPAGYTERRFTSLGGGIDVTLPICPMLDLRGECFLGQDLDDIRGGILQGVSAVSGGREIRSRGYWVEASVKPVDWYSLHIGTSRDNPYNGDVVLGTTAPTGAVDNHVFYLGNRFNAGGGFTFGFDYLHWITEWKGSLHSGVDDRFTFFTQFSF